MMRRFANTTIVALAISAPVLTGVLVDHSAVSLLGAPGGCSSNCSRGGADPGTAQGPASGGHFNITEFGGLFNISSSGTNVAGGDKQTGRTAGDIFGNTF